MGYKGSIRAEFFQILQLTKDATWKGEKYAKNLEIKAKNCRRIIKEQYNYGQNDLEDIIKEDPNLSKDLLNFKPDKSSLDYFIPKN